MAGRDGRAAHYMIGGGIASLAAAAFLIRDAGVPGASIRIFDDQPQPGGALDASGGVAEGYLTRGGRMFERNFVNTFDLLDDIPSADDPDISVSRDILSFNEEVRAASRCRLIAAGEKADMAHLGLGAGDIVALNRLLIVPERRLAGRTIGSWFDRDFFESNFWIMWSTMFSFQPWHALAEMRRYMRRFIHLLPGLTRIAGVLRTRYNQYDSLVSPLVAWLEERGVAFEREARVTGLSIRGDAEGRRVDRIDLADGRRLALGEQDRVYVTLGSMVDGATYGSNDRAPSLEPAPTPSWDLWKSLAARHDGFGRPEAFCADTRRTAWTSFTVTLREPGFRDFVEELTGNATGAGGLVTIRDSGWLMSFVFFRQPHFRAQPTDTTVFWGYGLRGDRNGDFVPKPMWEATGDEILAELAGQLRLGADRMGWFDGARVVPCRMPFITSQFMPRRSGDRPATCPPGAKNFALMGQFVEQPLDTVFTVEYSVRSARAAVHALTGRSPPLPVVRTDRDPAVLFRAARVLLTDGAASTAPASADATGRADTAR